MLLLVYVAFMYIFTCILKLLADTVDVDNLPNSSSLYITIISITSAVLARFSYIGKRKRISSRASHLSLTYYELPFDLQIGISSPIEILGRRRREI